MNTHHFAKFLRSLPLRANFNPIRSLNPESLTRILDDFQKGELRPAALLWDAIERRDDVLKSVTARRKKAIARLNWEIVTRENSETAEEQKEALQYFYENLRCCHACDRNERGGVALLIKQMMDSIGKKYAVHEIVFDEPRHGERRTTAQFYFVPLWFFENRSGKLRFLSSSEWQQKGVELQENGWLVTVGEGLMEACSIAYLFKHLPLRDWLIYSERNGMPGVKGITDAIPGSPQWEVAREAVEAFGAEFHTLMSKGSNIEAIDLSARGPLPYPPLIEYMDRAMAMLWTGADPLNLAHLMQSTTEQMPTDSRYVIEEDDAHLISETLNDQVDRPLLSYLFPNSTPSAFFRLKPSVNRNIQGQLTIYEKLWKMGLEISPRDLRHRFGIEPPKDDENPLYCEQRHAS